MRTMAILLGLIAVVVSAPLVFAQTPNEEMSGANCARANGPGFLVKAEGLKDRSGRVIAELYPANQGDFLRKKEGLLREGKLFRRVEAPVPSRGPVNLCIDAPKPGAYAVIFIHDRDGKSKFNIWKDGIGLPSGRALGAAAPRVSQATVIARSAIVAVPVQMQYMNGAAGFSPQRR